MESSHTQVVVSDSTLAAMDAARAAGRPLWRVSSTVFAHVRPRKLNSPFANRMLRLNELRVISKCTRGWMTGARALLYLILRALLIVSRYAAVIHSFMMWNGFHSDMCTLYTLQVASDQILRPLGVFASPETEQLYPPTLAGQFVQAELEAIRLKAN